MSFKEAQTVFGDSDALIAFDALNSDQEERFIILGMSLRRNVLIVCHCYRTGDLIRIISARKATKNETRQYEKGSV